MPQEILLNIVHQKLVFPLVLILLLYFIAWFVSMKLCFIILDIKIEIKRLLPAIFIACLYSLCGKFIIPAAFFGIITIFFMTILIKSIGKSKVLSISVFWTALVVQFIVGIGTVCIESTLCLLGGKNIAFFLINTPYGIAIATIIEMFFPLMALIILSNYKISLVPPFIKKVSRIEIIGIISSSLFFYVVYSLSIRVMISLKENSNQTSMYWIIMLGSLVGAILGFFFILMVILEQRKFERRLFAFKRQELKTKLVTEKTDLKDRFEKERTDLLKQNQKMVEEVERLKENNIDRQDFVDYSESMLAFHLRVERHLSSEVDLLEVTGIDYDSISDKELTPTDKKIIRLIGKGYSNPEITEELKICDSTLRKYVSGILDKLGLKNRTQLAIYAIVLAKKENNKKGKPK